MSILEWSAEQDAAIIDGRTANPPRSWSSIARSIRRNKTTVTSRGGALGFEVNQRVVPAVRPVKPAKQVMAAAPGRSAEPLPPGHTDTWAILTAGTLLDGERFA